MAPPRPAPLRVAEVRPASTERVDPLETPFRYRRLESLQGRLVVAQELQGVRPLRRAGR